MSASEVDLGGLRGEIRRNEPMSAHNSWRAGGRADRYVRPADIQDLCDLLQRLPNDEPLLWVGLGSNLLVRDGGFAGTVSATQGVNAIEQVDHDRFRIEAGAACNKVARVTAKAGCVGAEFLAGIPGTMGGALAMNAGAFGGETWPLVSAVETIDRDGKIHRRDANAFRFGYRHVEGPMQAGFVACELTVPKGDTEAAQTTIRALLARRNATQPTGLPSCGSVFKNPPGDHAARLIETAGLKEARIGGAQVSPKHANFIINTGGATAADIENLILKVQATVESRHGVRLEPEVQIIGEPAAGHAGAEGV